MSKNYTAIIDLTTSKSNPCFAYAILKFTYLIDDVKGVCELSEAEPLLYDIRKDNLKPRFPAGTDYWDTKLKTDVVIQGSAYAPNKNTTEMLVEFRLGSLHKNIQIFGKRFIEWDSNGKPFISQPEKFNKISLTYENAYGGIDWRVPIEENHPMYNAAVSGADHPGLYPRNPYGKGYIVKQGVLEKMEMPSLENPDDLLTNERLIINYPEKWYQQPLPWCFEWVNTAMFPRYIYLSKDCEPWFDCPEDETLLEVQYGFLEKYYKTRYSDVNFGDPPHAFFRQEASYGLSVEFIQDNEEVYISGMRPEGKFLKFRLPNLSPFVEIEIEGHKEQVSTHLNNLIIKPEEKTISLVYSAFRESPRIFIPGIHKHIPISLYVNNGPPIHYKAPETIKNKIEMVTRKK